MASEDDAIREALDNPEAVVDVPGDFDPMELEPLSDSSSSDSDMEDTYTVQELEILRKQISKPPKRPIQQRKRPPKRPMPQRKRRRKTTPQRKKNRENAKRRRDDMIIYNQFLTQNGKSTERNLEAIRIKLNEIIQGSSGNKVRAQELLADLNKKHPKRIKLRL